MLRSALVSALLAAAAQASANVLFVSSYSGKVTTLDLSGIHARRAGDSVPELKEIASSDGCSTSPSWLTLDHPKSTLYCIDEGLSTPQGSLASFKTNADGSLTKLDLVSTPNGPVSGVLYGAGGDAGIALAHYGGSAFSTWDIINPSSIESVQTEQFKLDHPGPVPDRQDAPHPHEAVLDPTGKFILVPDLGADLIRLYSVCTSGNLTVTSLPAVSVKPGSGPRHIAFAVKNGVTFMYLVTEIASTIIGYEVTYPEGSIEFRELFNIGCHGAGKPVPAQAFASEVVVSPDANFLTVSSRNENTFTIPNFDSSNSTKITSDPIINFSIDASSGSLTPIQEVPCGGRYPRQFSMNKAGTLLAVGEQNDGRVVLIERDPKTGKLGGFVGYANVAGQITSVIFNE